MTSTASPSPMGPGRFLALVGTYVLGVFNDNLFKQAVMLLALAQGRKEWQGVAALLFTLPFVVLAAPAGWLADRFPKRRVILGAKALEIAAALIGFAALWRGNLALMVIMVGAMGLQSALFSPALNGSLPELFPRERLVWVNGILRVGVTLGILAGVASAGMALDLPLPKLGHVPWGRGLVGLGVLSFSLAGWALAWLIPRRGASDPSRPFPWSGPWETLRELRSIGADRPLGRILLLDALLWSMGVFQLLLINALGKEQFGFSDRATSLLVMAQMLGLAVGGLGAAHGAQGKAWLRMLAPSAWLMALGMGLVWLVPQTALALQNPLLFGGVALAGLGGGLLLVPTETFLQARPAPERKGATWAAANFASFSGMTLASGLYILVNRVAPTHAYGGLAALSLAIALWLMVELRHPAWEG